MNRIFLTLVICGNLTAFGAFALGWMIDDPTVADATVQSTVSWHLKIGVAAIVFAMMLHALTLTYFMGTGRWVEETSRAYRLGADYHQRNQKLKYQTLPGLIVCLVMFVVTGARGAATDPASHVGFTGWFGIPAPTIHFLVAAGTIALNLVVNYLEYDAISRNAVVISDVVVEVNRIRHEKGLVI